MNALLEVRNIVKRFDGVVALDGVSADISANQITAVIGPNGSGKTSLMNVISGFYHADSGSVRLADEETVGCAPHLIARYGIARTFQHIRLFDEMTVLQNVLVAAERRGLRGALDRSRAALRLVALSSVSDYPATALSYGHRRRLEIARALATEPKVLILDEPAAGMNATEKVELGVLLQEIRETNVTILLVEHDMSLVMNISDHVIALNFGRVIADGKSENVRRDPQVIEAYLGSSDD